MGRLCRDSTCVHAKCAVAGIEKDLKSDYTGTKHSISGFSREGKSLGCSRLHGSSSLYVALFTFTMGPEFWGCLPSSHACAPEPDENLASHQLSSFPGRWQAGGGWLLPVTVGSGSGRGWLGVAVCSITTLKCKEKSDLGVQRRPTQGRPTLRPHQNSSNPIYQSNVEVNESLVPKQKYKTHWRDTGLDPNPSWMLKVSGRKHFPKEEPRHPSKETYLNG